MRQPPALADLDGQGRHVDADDVEPLVLQVQGVPAGATADIQHAAGCIAQRRLLVRRPIPARGDVHSGTRCSDEAVVSLHDLEGAFAFDVVREHVAERVAAIIQHSSLQAARSPVTMTVARERSLFKKARYRV